MYCTDISFIKNKNKKCQLVLVTDLEPFLSNWTPFSCLLSDYWFLEKNRLCMSRHETNTFFCSTLFWWYFHTLQVSWIRHKDTHLLTLGLYSYTKDPRLSAIHRSNSEDWVLEIRNTLTQDAGLYEILHRIYWPKKIMTVNSNKNAKSANL